MVEALVETLEHFGLIYFYFPVEGTGRKEEGGRREEEGERRKEEVRRSMNEQKKMKGEEDDRREKEGGRWREERREERGKRKEEEGKRDEEQKVEEEGERRREEGERRKEGRLKLEVGGFFKAVIEMIFDILSESKEDETIVRMIKLLAKYTLGEVKPVNLGQEMLKSKKRNEKYFINISCLGLDQIPHSYSSQEALSIQAVILVLKNILKVMRTKKKRGN